MKKYLYAVALVLGALAIGQALSPVVSQKVDLLEIADAGNAREKEPGL